MRNTPVSAVYAHAQNLLLSFIARELNLEEKLPSHADLSRICGVSVTTIHRILKALRRGRLFSEKDGALYLKRLPVEGDFLPEPQALSRRDEVEQSLIEMFMGGEFPAGQSFSELSLARTHGVATVTIREALLNLARLGIFTKEARKQWRVVEVDRDIVNELMDLRRLMECFALERYFDRPDPAITAEFHRIYQAMFAGSRRAKQSVEDFVRLDRELHQTILSGAGNRFLKEYSQYISFPIQVQFLRRAFNVGLRQKGSDEHLKLLRAINANRADAAVQHLKDHLDHARQTLLGLVNRSSDVAAPR